MRSSLIVSLLAALLWTVAGGFASAQPGDQPTAEDWVKSKLGRTLRMPRKDVTFADAFKGIEREFFSADVDGGGVTAEDEALSRDLQNARRRSSLLVKMLALDLDGDGVITREEAARALSARAFKPLNRGGSSIQPTREQGKKILEGLIAKEFVGDRNSDSRITFDEMRAHVSSQLKNRPGIARGRRSPTIPADFDRNGDGRIVLEEIRVVAKRVFDQVDTDGDGVLSPQEAAVAAVEFRAAQAAVRKAAAERRQRAKVIASARGCGIPDLSDSKGLYFLGMGDGAAMTGISLGRKPTAVSLIDIKVADGPEQLDLVAAGLKPVVYRFSGATKRVRRFIAANKRVFANGKAMAAVQGLPRDRIVFGTGSKCLGGSIRIGSRSRGVEGYLEALSAVFGRKIDGHVNDGHIGEISVPSLTITRTRPPRNSAFHWKTDETKGIWQMAEQYNQAGLARVSVKDLVVPGPVATHAVLPAAAGLAQLVEKGVLEVTKWRTVQLHRSTKDGSTGTVVSGNVTFVGVGKVIEARLPEEVRIVAETELPVHARGPVARLRYMLAPGVPMPRNPGEHACIFSEATGKQLSGPRRC